MGRAEKTLSLAKDIGTTPVTAYTVPADTLTVITGIVVCNTTGSNIQISISIVRSSTEYFIIKSDIITPKDPLTFKGHLILDTAADYIKIVSDTVTSADSVISGWEKT